ncbi:MAG: MaoC/PaaZ C-terminal domain-containing protein [Novosphingobium sp.]
MIKDYDALMGMTPVVMEQRYSHKDSCLYALSVGCGLDPADDWMRRYLGPLPPSLTLPGMATVLAAPRLHAIGLGVTLSGVLHGSQGLIAYAALPTEGHVRSESRVASVFDRGDGRGCLINMVRELRDVDTGTHYASLQMTFICRSDQVAGAPPVEKAASEVEPEREPDIVVQVPTSTQAAQLFALTGDQNPLHMVPDVAAKAGFPRPILHGVATYGLCAAFAEKALCMDAVEASGRRLSAISGRFNAPVFPGETIELALWREATGARIEARVPVRDKVVFAGRIAIEEDC